MAERIGCWTHDQKLWGSIPDVGHANSYILHTEYYSKLSKVVFIILSPSTIEVSHPVLMRQFELYAIVTPAYSTHVHWCMPSEW